jgi:hypothetical protein
MYAVHLVCPDVLHLTAGVQQSATDWHKETCIPHFLRSVKDATSIQAKVKYVLLLTDNYASHTFQQMTVST